MKPEMTREWMLRSQRHALTQELKRLQKSLVNVEVRLEYYDGQLAALRSVPHLEAAE